MKKIISLALIIALLSNLLPLTSLALGTEAIEAATGLTENIRLAEGVFYTDARQEEHYISYTPNTAVTPVVVYGEKLSDRGDYNTFAQLLENRGWNVVCGVNGDYYVVATSVPVGLIISEGKIITSDAGNWAVGFNADGTAFFGLPTLTSRLYIGSETYRLGGINKSVQRGDFYLYTDDFGADTGIGVPAINAVLSYPEGTDGLSYNCAVELTVEAVSDSDGPFEIPEGKLVLSLVKGSDDWRAQGIGSLQIGSRVRLELSGDERWSNAAYATGSLYRLVENGVKSENLDKIDKTAAPRTAVGIRPDKTVIFYTIDGRQSDYSKGLSLSEAADRLIELGCSEAGALDGGGSTNIQARYPGDNTYTPINRPSLGREREVTSYIMLAAKNPGSGEPKTLSIRPFNAVMLSGASLRMTAGACDETGRTVPSEGLVTYSADKGDITSDGLFTAPADEGIATVSAVYGNLSDSVGVRVIKTPDSISIINEETGRNVSSLTLDVKTTVKLGAVSLWHLLDVTAADSDYTWSVDGGIGTIDGDGTFTSSSRGGAGIITVTAGEHSCELGVLVKTGIMTGDGFESVEAGVSEGVEWSQEISADYVRYGYGSMKAVYDLAEGDASIPLGLEWAKASRYITLWIYGDGSGNQIYARQNDTRLFVADLNYSGWRQFTVETGSRGGISGLIISGTGSGTIWLDQLLLTDYETPDLEAPYLSLSINKLMVYGSASDAVDGFLDSDNISITLDGEPIGFQYDELTGYIYAAIEESGEIRRLTLTAHDSSGNLYSVSATTEGVFDPVFGDMTAHWAEDYVNYMHKLGVVAGVEDINGRFNFEPDKAITRAQFAAMICRWLKIDTESYADQEMSFADAADIPSWALNYVKAVNALGIIKGMPENGGIYFKPNSTLTRAQAMTVLGRTLEGGRMSADLYFDDVEAIPSWSLRYVSLLVFAGVIKGYDDNTLRPDTGLTRAQVCKILTEMT